MDDGDPLSSYRERFVIDDPQLVYLDGNSLGRSTKAGRDRVIDVLEREWARDLISSWETTWMDLPTRIGDLIGTGLLGTREGEVLVNDSTTIALYKAISAAIGARPDRNAIVIEEDNFPTDRYLVESLAGQHGLDVRWIPAADTDGVSVEAVEAALDEQVAVAVLSHVDYRSAAILDMAPITEAVHRVGALVLWDLCHSAGAIEIDLASCAVDIAVGCTYKYLNGGPGSPAFTYVRTDLQAELHQPIWGWWSRQEMFEMGPGYQPEPGIRAWLTGTPGVLSLVGVEPAVELTLEAGMAAIREKSVALTTFAVDLYDEILAPLGWRLASPRDAHRRGSHITLTRSGARELMPELAARKVLPDYRRPDGIRIGLAPLTTRFTDVYDGLATIAQLS